MSEQRRLSDDAPLPRDRIFPIARGFVITSMVGGVAIAYHGVGSDFGPIGVLGLLLVAPYIVFTVVLVAGLYPALILLCLLVFVYAPLRALGWLTWVRFVAGSVTLASVAHAVSWLSSFQPRAAYATPWHYLGEGGLTAGAVAGVFWISSRTWGDSTEPHTNASRAGAADRAKVDSARRLATVLKEAGFSEAQVVERLEADGAERTVAVKIAAKAFRTN